MKRRRAVDAAWPGRRRSGPAVQGRPWRRAARNLCADAARISAAPFPRPGPAALFEPSPGWAGPCRPADLGYAVRDLRCGCGWHRRARPSRPAGSAWRITGDRGPRMRPRAVRRRAGRLRRSTLAVTRRRGFVQARPGAARGPEPSLGLAGTRGRLGRPPLSGAPPVIYPPFARPTRSGRRPARSWRERSARARGLGQPLGD